MITTLTSAAECAPRAAARHEAVTRGGSGRPARAETGCPCPFPDCPAPFRTLSLLPATDPDRLRMRNRLAEAHLGLANHLAGRFASHGTSLEDLRQVAAMALVQAVDRFDPGYGVPFPAFAVPTIVGSLKRHRRDTEWVIAVPRRLKDLRRRALACADELTQRLSRAPTIGEVAAVLGCPADEVAEALQTEYAHQPVSLDAPLGRTGEEPTLGARYGGPDSDLENVPSHLALGPLTSRLSPREQQVLALRFYGNCTQVQIAAEIGCSQMQVSRLLSHALRQLRTWLTADEPPAGRPAQPTTAGRRPR